jgi:hypothetical protein
MLALAHAGGAGPTENVILAGSLALPLNWLLPFNSTSCL